MRENTQIIQKYCNNEDKLIYELIIKDEIANKNDKDFYDKLRYILLKEIKKVPNIDYRYKILKNHQNQMKCSKNQMILSKFY